MKIEQAAEEFLSSRRIAVTGVSHAPTGHGSNAVYQRLRERGMTVIEGGCPLMFGKASDGGHRAMCWLLKWTGSVPRTV